MVLEPWKQGSCDPAGREEQGLAWGGEGMGLG